MLVIYVSPKVKAKAASLAYGCSYRLHTPPKQSLTFTLLRSRSRPRSRSLSTRFPLFRTITVIHFPNPNFLTGNSFFFPMEVPSLSLSLILRKQIDCNFGLAIVVLIFVNFRLPLNRWSILQFLGRKRRRFKLENQNYTPGYSKSSRIKIWTLKLIL